MDVQLVALLHKETEHVWLVESGSEVHGHAVVAVFAAEARKLEVQQRERRIVLSESDVLDVNIEESVPVLLDESQVDWVAEDDCASRVPRNWRDLEGDVGELEALEPVWLSSVDFDGTVVRVEHGVRVLFLYNNLEVVRESTVPDAVGPESELP